MAEPSAPQSGDVFPRPDPTALTTAQLYRELGLLQQLIETRFNGMDIAILLDKERVALALSAATKEIECLTKLHEEKFRGIEVQLRERDIRVESTATLVARAVDAALQAAEKAVGKANESFALSIDKSEAAFSKQIDTQSILLQTTNQAQTDKIDDLKDRMTLIEGRGMGTVETRSTQAINMGHFIGLGGILIAVATLVTHFAGK